MTVPALTIETFEFPDLLEWQFCTDFSTLNCSTLNIPGSEIRTEVKIKMVFDISPGTGKFSVISANVEESFETDFGNFDQIQNGTLTFFISAETNSTEDVRPFGFLKFEQNIRPLAELKSALNSYAIVLVVAAGFFLCVLCGLAEKTPTIGKQRELSSNPEDNEMEMGLIADMASAANPK